MSLTYRTEHREGVVRFLHSTRLHVCVRNVSDEATLGGIVSDKLSLSCWQCRVEVAVHAEQQENKQPAGNGP